jgi:hypothetical protein
MIKKTLTWTDFNDKEVTEDFYFHLSKPEVLQLEVGVKGGLTELIKKVIETEDHDELVTWFKKIILLSYGQKSEDGRRFIKSPQLSEEFAQTGAYEVLFMGLAGDEQAASQFIKGILPADVQDKPKIQVTDVGPDRKAPPSIKDLQNMTADEFVQINRARP